MTTDTIRLIFTYLIAILVLVGSFFLLMIETRIPPEQILPFVTGIVGLVVGFIFNKESSTAGSRATERAVAQGANAGAQSVAQ